MRIQISIDDDLLERIDKFAVKNFMTRSALLQQSALSYIQSREFLSLLPDMSMTLKNIAAKEDLSDEDSKQIKDMENVVSMFRSNMV